MESMGKYGTYNVISDLPDGEGKIKINEFLTNLSKGFCRQIVKYLQFELGDIPLQYSERKLHAFFVPAFSQFGEDAVFFMEAPVLRKWTSLSKIDFEDSYGWVDYWCYYKNLTFLIELKYDYLSAKEGIPTKGTINRWKEANDQLNIIKDYNSIQLGDELIVKIAFHVLAINEAFNSSEPKFSNDKNYLLEIQQNCMDEFKNPKAPNWSFFWKLPNNYCGPYGNDAGKKEIFPGVVFLARVDKSR